MLSIADALASSRVKIVNITGGEPFLHPKLTNVIDHCHKHFKIVISTHGMFLNKELMSELTSKVDLIGVSLDTLVKDDAKLMRGKNYYLNKVLANIGLILSSNVGLKFNTIVTKHNKDSLKEIANFIRSLEYPNVTWKLYETTINNNVSKAGRLLKVPHNQFMSLIQELKAKHADLRIIYSDSDTMNSAYIIITPNGDVHVPQKNNFMSLGNLLEQSLFEILDRVDFDFDLNSKVMTYI